MINTYSFTHSVETDVSPEAIWTLYEDVTSWPRWDAQAELITRNGPFEAGVTGTMKFVGQDPLPYRLARVEPPHIFVDETPVGALVVRVSHLLTPLPDGRLRIDYSAEIDGPEDQAQQVGPMITADFPGTMASLIALAKERSS
ncbi:MAG TPA: SRPBCC family protein [Propionibacteriaceae bacterium]